MSATKTIAVDFDSTISLENKYPYIGELNMDAISVLKDYQSKGGRIILWTAREGEPLFHALEALKNVNFIPDIVNDNFLDRVKKYGHNCRKVSADKIIDDLDIDFTGDWEKYRRILITDNPYFKGKLSGFRMRK